MTTRQLIAQSLIYHWRSHVAVLLCVAVGTTVLGGALLVGDSMRGSLRELTLDRLGRIEHALSAQRFFAADLALRVGKNVTYPGAANAHHGTSVSDPVIPAIVLRGSASSADASGRESARAGRVQVWGVTREFWQLNRSGREPPWAARWDDADQGDTAVINASLARELDVRAGDTVLVRIETPSDVPREAALGRKSDTIQTLRLTVGHIATVADMGSFRLDAGQRDSRNLFIPLHRLARAVGQPDRANTLLVRELPRDGRSWPNSTTDRAASETAELQGVLAEQIGPIDLGLQLRVDETHGYVALESRRMMLEPPVASAAEQAAAELRVEFAPALAYLANSIEFVSARDARRDAPQPGYSLIEVAASPLWLARTAATGTAESYRSRRRHEIPYSIVAAVPVPGETPFALPRPKLGAAVEALADDEILLNDWAADDLGVQPGDSVEITYFVAEPLQPHETTTTRFRVRAVVPIEGAAADPRLVPDYPGITDAKTYGDWDPPFPMDLKRVRPKDEEYWEKYRTTPKAFVSLAAGERLWGSRFGKWTSIRFAPAGTSRQGESGTGGQGEKEIVERISPSPSLPLSPSESLTSLRARFERELLTRLRPEQLGLQFQPVKAQGLEASRGGTDFGQLFLAFSFFLIVSAAILIALVFRLGVERRAKQIGLLLAVGFDRSRVSRLLIAEGLIVAGVGCAFGLAGAIGYAWAVMAGLRTWWLPAVGTSLLRLHVPLSTLGIGAAAGMALAAIAIVASVRGLTRLPARALIAGAVTDPMGRPTGSARRLKLSFMLGCGALAVAAGLVPAAALVTDSAVLFFLVGTSLLIAAISFLTSYLTADGQRPVRGRGAVAVARLGARNAGRSRGRSVLTASLVASATFVIVAVGANRTDEPAWERGTHAASGGFSVVAESDVPLLYDLNSPAGRGELGIPDSASDSFNDVRVFPFRVKEGEDASCLNLYQPTRPRVLGAPPALIARGGFRVQSSLAESVDEKDNPWRLLDKNLGDKVTPAIGDANSVRWILKLGLGDRLSITADDGREVELQVVAMLDKSIFQSELVISEANFRKLFPSQAGYSYFLIEEQADGKNAEGEGQSAESQNRTQSKIKNQKSKMPPTPLTPHLEQHLADFGFDATPVAERLAEYHAVENTYLSTFQMLGGLGLVLGTLGLGAVLLRSVLDRRGELALLLAVGFRPGLLVWMVLAESGFLLIFGLIAGAVSALVAVAPHVMTRAAELPWASLAGTLGMVLAAGVASSVAAVFATLRTPLLPALRSE